jgi:hypothetical protein
MSPEEIEKGEALARAATPGEWMPDGEDFWTVQGGPCMGLVAQVGNPAYPCSLDEHNARFIAHHSPDRLLSLYADLKKARAALEWIEQHAKGPAWVHHTDGPNPIGGVALVARALSEVRK